MIVHDPSSSYLQPFLESLQNAYAQRRLTTDGPASCLLLDRHGLQVAQLLTSFEEHVRSNGGEVLSGTWREGLRRPFGGFLDVVDDLAGRMLKLHPELLSRYGRTLITLLPRWHAAQPLRRLREISSGLADFILHGDQGGLDEYYRKRNLAPLVTADLVNFTLDASVALSERTGAPTVLILQDVQFADPLTINALELLHRYARKVPMLICATARDTSEPVKSRSADDSEPLRAWRTFLLPGPATAADDENSWLIDKARLSPEHFELLQAASVLVLPFDKATWLRLAPEHMQAGAEDALENLVETHLLRRVGDERFTFSYAKLREAIYRSLSPECRRKHHTTALSAEAVDPFACTWHSDLAGLPAELRQHSLQAMERAWGVSAYECAIAFAADALGAANAPDGVDGDVLMALLHYEAGRYIDAERFLLAALEKERHQKIDRTTLERLLGYNAIFGLGDFERGRTIMELVLKKYEESGREKDAGYVRNAIAFALLRTRRFDEAVEIENLTLGLIENSAQQQDGFLFSLLQLNLARLYRTLGESEQALELFRKGMAVQNSDLSPYILLIFHGSLAYLHIAREDYAAALDAYHHCLELSRDLELGNINDQLLDLLSRQFGSPLMKRATRGDQAFSSLYTNLAWLYQKMGLHDRAAAYTDGMRSHWKFLGEEIWQNTEVPSKTSSPTTAFMDNTDAEQADGDEAQQARTHYLGLVHEAADSQQLLEAIAEALEQKRTVAVVSRHSVGAQAQLVDSLVIYDPREAALAQRVNAEIGAASGPSARAGLLLPEAVGLFSGGLEPMPLVLQEASLKPEHRGWLKALLPYRIRMQVLSPDFDGFLFEILRAFARRTGVHVLAAAPFHLRGRDLSVTPEKALESYLVSSIDYLALGQQLLAKTHGATAAENLMPFHPRLSQHASIVDETEEQKETFLIQVRTWPSPNYLRLRREMRPLLNLCDGRRSVAEVASQLNPEGNNAPDYSHRVHNFLRDLWRHGAICFDAPVLQ
jgi:tetratricopeptide (TPR) repeat protein